MTTAEMEMCLERCKNLQEAAQLMREYYNCPDTHTKVKTWVYMKLPAQLSAVSQAEEVPLMQLECEAFENIACAECKNKKRAPYDQ